VIWLPYTCRSTTSGFGHTAGKTGRPPLIGKRREFQRSGRLAESGVD
jgi:hypothetical protein